MRVFLVVHGFPPSALGGTEVYADALARTLTRQHGDQVFVLTREQDAGAPQYRVRRESRDGFTIAWINNTFRDTRTFEETYENRIIGRIAERLIDEFRPDVGHVHHLTCLSTTIVQTLADRAIPCLMTLHDYWLLCHRGQLFDRNLRACDGPEPSRCHACLDSGSGAGHAHFDAAPALRAITRRLPEAPARWLRRAGRRIAAMTSSADRTARQADARLAHMREVCVRATRLLAPSSYLRDRFIAAGIPADRIALVDLGVERMSTAAIARTPSRVLRLGFLGTMMVSKAPDVLLEAFRRLPQGEATVDLIGAYSPYHGDNSYQATLAPLLTLPGVRTHGELTHQQVLHALGSIDVLVVPSRWPENSPFVIPEAFLAGIPVVASRIGGIPEAVQDGRNGLLFRAGDVGDLHRVLTRLLREPALLPSLRAGIPTVRSIEEDAAGTRAIYGQIIAGRNAHPSHQSPGPPRADPDT